MKDRFSLQAISLCGLGLFTSFMLLIHDYLGWGIIFFVGSVIGMCVIASLFNPDGTRRKK